MFEFLRSVEYTDITVIDSSFSAGAGTPFNDGKSTTIIDKDFIKSAKTPFLIHITGDSMHPTLSINDKAVIDFEHKGENGDILAISLNGEQMIKEFRKTRNGYVLHSHNTKYKDIEIQDTDNFFVFGKVISYQRML